MVERDAAFAPSFPVQRSPLAVSLIVGRSGSLQVTKLRSEQALCAVGSSTACASMAVRRWRSEGFDGKKQLLQDTNVLIPREVVVLLQTLASKHFAASGQDAIAGGWLRP
jgi:hypothetical protein